MPKVSRTVRNTCCMHIQIEKATENLGHGWRLRWWTSVAIHYNSKSCGCGQLGFLETWPPCDLNVSLCCFFNFRSSNLEFYLVISLCKGGFFSWSCRAFVRIHLLPPNCFWDLMWGSLLFTLCTFCANVSIASVWNFTWLYSSTLDASLSSLLCMDQHIAFFTHHESDDDGCYLLFGSLCLHLWRTFVFDALVWRRAWFVVLSHTSRMLVDAPDFFLTLELGRIRLYTFENVMKS